MRTVHATACLALVLTLGCTTTPPARPLALAGDQPYELQVDSDEVSMSVQEGQRIPLPEFARIAQSITGKTITYHRDTLAAAGPGVSFLGTVRVPKESFFEFFQTMLYVNGLACVERSRGTIEIVPAARPENG